MAQEELGLDGPGQAELQPGAGPPEPVGVLGEGRPRLLLAAEVVEELGAQPRRQPGTAVGAARGVEQGGGVPLAAERDQRRDLPLGGHGVHERPRHGRATARRPRPQLAGQVTERSAVVVDARDQRVERAARQRGSDVVRLADPGVHQGQAVPDGGGLRGRGGHREHRADLVQAPVVEVAPAHERRRARGAAGHRVAVTVASEAVGELDAPAPRVRGDTDHQLGGDEARRRGTADPGQPREPALGEAEVEAVDDGDDGGLGGAHGLVEGPARDELRDGLLRAALVDQQPAVRRPGRGDRPAAAAVQAFEQVLAEARVRLHRDRRPAPAQRQVATAQRREPGGGVGVAEADGAVDGHGVEQRGPDQELAVGVVEAAQDARRQVALQRVVLPAEGRDVRVGAPRLEQDPRHPAPRRRHRRVGVDPVRAGQPERLRRLVHGERELGLGQRADAPAQHHRPEVERQLLAADQDDLGARGRVPDQRLDHRHGVGRPAEPFEIVDDQQHRLPRHGLGEQADRLGVRDARGHRPHRDARGRGHPGRERGLQVDEQAPGRGLRGVDAQPGHRQAEAGDRPTDGGGLARARRRHDRDDRVARDEPGQPPVEPRALDPPLGQRGRLQLGAHHGGALDADLGGGHRAPSGPGQCVPTVLKDRAAQKDPLTGGARTLTARATPRRPARGPRRR